MQRFTSPKIIYLENTEFDSNYNLKSNIKNMATGKPFFSGTTIVLVQTNSCGYCNKFKPVYQQVAERVFPNVEFATIQVDGNQVGEHIFKTPALDAILGEPLQGVPVIYKFKGGQRADTYNGPREPEPFMQWVLQ